MVKHNQSGRSMVEMLGVLAIIGVLSVGGIAGYKQAMIQHKVNKLVNDVHMNTFTIADCLKQSQSSCPNNLGEYRADFGQYPNGYWNINFSPEICEYLPVEEMVQHFSEITGIKKEKISFYLMTSAEYGEFGIYLEDTNRIKNQLKEFCHYEGYSPADIFYFGF